MSTVLDELDRGAPSLRAELDGGWSRVIDLGWPVPASEMPGTLSDAEVRAWEADIADEGFVGLDEYDGADQPRWAHGLSAEPPGVAETAVCRRA